MQNHPASSLVQNHPERRYENVDLDKSTNITLISSIDM